MGYTWRSNSDGTADAVECDEFAEVVYDDDRSLVVNVARSVTRDPHMEDALVDALAINERRQAAELAVYSVAQAYGLDVHPDGPDGQRALTLTPPAAGEAGPP
jgi:hypothetical protein